MLSHKTGSDALENEYRPATHTDFIKYVQIFYPQNLAKIQIVFLKICQNTEFFLGSERDFLIFSLVI